MKVGIISEFNTNKVNYGNNLQAYALNAFLNSRYKKNCYETIQFSNSVKKRWTKIFSKKIVARIFSRIKRKLLGEKSSVKLMREDLSRFKGFSEKHIIMSENKMNWKALKKSDYDMLIVGSDIVWAQSELCINRIKFLDFNNKKNFRKVSYAASFFKNWIPVENRKQLHRMLSKFEYISVREKAAIKLLDDIGIKHVEHTLDPTLLLSREKWEDIASKPQADIDNKYVFAYLLCENDEKLEPVKKRFAEKGLKLVTVFSNTVSDYQVKNCSVEEWIWLIANADYVVTDSFHGVAFSTIFQKKFIAVNRFDNIEERIMDYLSTINQEDKAMKISEIGIVDNLKWNYTQINESIEKCRRKSVEYLDRIFID